MFQSCSALTSLDVSKLNTSKVTDMGYMFSLLTGLTSLDIKKIDTKSAQSLEGMFSGSSSLTSLDLSNFDTGNVTDMRFMFNQCAELPTLDLSSFSTTNIGNNKLGSMFSGCSKLITIYCNETWPTGHSLVFVGCQSLVGNDGTVFSSSKTSSNYAHPNTGGYFTKKGSTIIITGDANNNGVLEVDDITEIANYLMGKPSEHFNISAADVNGDGIVNVADIVALVALIK